VFAQLINRGIHVTVAAGNSADDAGYYSPARAPAVTTVGAIGIDDFRASYSNYGASVDIFAPGTNIISTWSTGDYVRDIPDLRCCHVLINSRTQTPSLARLWYVLAKLEHRL